MKIEGSGSESGSTSHRHGSAHPDPDPNQNVMDPQHWFLGNNAVSVNIIKARFCFKIFF
jgi:hypothetical protein